VLLALPAKIAVKEKKLVLQMESMESMANMPAKTVIKTAAKKEKERKENPVVQSLEKIVAKKTTNLKVNN
jgi:hypothetical protein